MMIEPNSLWLEEGMQERLQMQETQFTMHESMYINVSEFSNVCSVTKFQHI